MYLYLSVISGPSSVDIAVQSTFLYLSIADRTVRPLNSNPDEKNLIILLTFCIIQMANAGVSTDVRKSNSTVEPPTTNHDVTKIVKDKKNVFLTHGEPLFRSTYLKENQAPNSTEDITVIPEINGDIKAIVAVRTENGQTVAYRSIKKNNGNFELTVPAGIYDICALGYCDNRKGTVIVTKENVELNENTNLNIDLSEAFNTVQLKRISPSGEELKISDEYGNGEECGPGMAVNFIDYKGIKVLEHNVNFFSEADAQKFVKSNFTEGPFSFTTLQTIASTEGMLNLTIPVDFTKPEAGSTKEGWQLAETFFSPTPVNTAYTNLIYQMGLDPLEVAYSMMEVSYFVHGKYDGGSGLGIEGLPAYSSGKIGFWKPENYNDAYFVLAYPIGDILSGNNSCVVALPFMAGETEPVQINTNFSASYILARSSNCTFSLDAQFPFYNKTGSLPLANCCPVLITNPIGQPYPNFNYIGRHGEVITIDSWNMPMFTNEPEFIEMLGGLTNTVKVSVNGDLISDNRIDFPDGIDWTMDGVYEIEFKTDNVLVNEGIKGHNYGILSYDSKTYKKTLPSVTAFQVVNKNNAEITDMIAGPEDGFIRLFAGSFEYREHPETHIEYNAISELSSIKVEYSPYGEGQYEELSVDMGELFIEPGFGQQYNIELSSVDRKSANGWYDIRISLKNSEGITQIQEMSPAFNIASISGAESINMCNNGLTKSYYSLQGVKLDSPTPGTVVIERCGDKTRKLIIK